MRKAFLSSITCLLAGAGVTWAQPWSGPTAPSPAKPWQAPAAAGPRTNWFCWPSAEQRGEVLPAEGAAAPTPESPYAGYPPPAQGRQPCDAPNCDIPMTPDGCEYAYYTWVSVEEIYWKI